MKVYNGGSSDYFDESPLTWKLQQQTKLIPSKSQKQLVSPNIFIKTSYPKVKSLHSASSQTKLPFSLSGEYNQLSPVGYFPSSIFKSENNIGDNNDSSANLKRRKYKGSLKEEFLNEQRNTSKISDRELKNIFFSKQQSEQQSTQMQTTQSLVSSDTLELKKSSQNELFLSRSSFSMKNLENKCHQNLSNESTLTSSPKRSFKLQPLIIQTSYMDFLSPKSKSCYQQENEQTERNLDFQSPLMSHKNQLHFSADAPSTFRNNQARKSESSASILGSSKIEMCFNKTQSQMAMTKYLSSLDGQLKMLSQTEKQQEKKVQQKQINREVARFGIDPLLVEQNLIKKKQMLRKVVNKIKIAKLFQKQGSVNEKHQRFEKLKHANYLEELAKYNSGRSISEQVLLRDLYYKVQALITDLNSIKRASLIIQTIRGLTPNIKSLIFMPEPSYNPLVGKPPVLLKSMKTLEEFEKDFYLQNKTKIGNGKKQATLNEETVKELNVFLKYLTDFLEKKQSPDFSVIKTQLSEMKEILTEPSKNRTSINPDKQRKTYFNEVMVAFNQEPSQFTRTSRIFNNIQQREKDLGPFQIVTPFVRQQEKKISTHCDFYCLLE